MSLELQDIRFGFGPESQLFDGLSLMFASGETTAIVGPSGSGKSTIVRLLCGLLRPRTGAVVADNQEVCGAGSVRGLLFQDDTLVPWLRADANAAFPLGLKDNPRLKAKVRERLGEVGLAHAMDRRPHEMSAGMKKRLEFVRATLADDKFLIADEPFTGLDFQQRRVLWEQWRLAVHGGARTGVIVTHDVAEVAAIADRLVVICATLPSQIVLDMTVTRSSKVSELEASIADALRMPAEASVP